MFGYVRPYTPEMKMAEYEKYRAVYCGLCREIGRTSGQLSRMGLTYDIVLLCSVRMVLEGIDPVFVPYRCPAHFTSERLVLCPNSATEFTAAAFAALAAAKNDDDLNDEHGAGRLKPILLSPFMAHLKKCAGKKLPDNAPETVAELLGRLSRLEAEKSPSSDETSRAFGEVLGYIFSLGFDGEKREIAETFGRAVGKFVYICDAVDDLPGDRKKRRYNPLIYGWGEMATDDGKVSSIVKESVMTAVPLSLEPLGEAAEKLDRSHPLTPIIKNIVYLGLPASLERVLTGKKEHRNMTGDPK